MCYNLASSKLRKTNQNLHCIFLTWNRESFAIKMIFSKSDINLINVVTSKISFYFQTFVFLTDLMQVGVLALTSGFTSSLHRFSWRTLILDAVAAVLFFVCVKNFPSFPTWKKISSLCTTHKHSHINADKYTLTRTIFIYKNWTVC